MTLNEIKEAVKEGKTVCWKQSNYTVEHSVGTMLNQDTMKHEPTESYDIVCSSNDHRIGLTWTDNVTMNGKEEDFYIKNKVNS